MISRRDFTKTCGAAMIGLAAKDSWAQTTTSIHVRKDVATLDESSSDIKSLRKGVAAMRALATADTRSWQKQAEIHGFILGAFRLCKHGNWFFLPWHRGYLYYFEEIIRKLSDDEGFALPYWDWSRNFKLPTPFLTGTLDNPARPGQMGSGRGVGANSTISQDDLDEFVGPSVISRILNITDFETFGGLASTDPMANVGAGELEQTPHNFIHRWVNGDMVTGGSPFDPIFWLHHCNIDRMWSRWMDKHTTGLPNDNDWLNTSFKDFCDRDGNTTQIAVKDVIDSTKLGYQYGTTTTTPPQLAGVNKLLLPAMIGRSATAVDSTAASFALSTQPDHIQALNRITQGASSAANQTIRVTLSGIKVPEQQNCSMRVFVNCKLLSSNTPISDPSYVGSFTFLESPKRGDGSHGDGTISVTMNAKPAFAKLYGDRPLKPDEPLSVSIVARPLFPNRDNAWKGKIQELEPSQVRFEIVGSRS